MNAVLPTIRSLGAELVAISPQLPRFLREMKIAHALDFDILHDPGNSVAETFGIAMQLPDDLITIYKRFGIDLVRFNGDAQWRLPVPARFVVSRNGLVKAEDADPDYRVRPEPEQTITVLREIR